MLSEVKANNMAEYSINITEIKDYAAKLRAGDRVLLNGTVYTSRDAAHKRIFELLDNGGELPFELEGACIYFAGPTPTPEGMVIGSCGPTTSGRMDVYSPRLLDLGLSAMIGKGERNKDVCDAIVRNKAVYFCAIGGAGALYARQIKSCREIFSLPKRIMSISSIRDSRLLCCAGSPAEISML